MAPPNEILNQLPSGVEGTQLNHFELCVGKLTVGGTPLLHNIPRNVTFTPHSSLEWPSESAASYLMVDVWHRVDEFNRGGVSLRFLIIDDGWQSISFNNQKNPEEGSRDLVLGGTYMTTRLYWLEEGDKFKVYKSRLILGPNAPSFNLRRLKKLIMKAIELKHAEKDLDRAVQVGTKIGLADLRAKTERLQAKLDETTGSYKGNLSRVGADPNSPPSVLLIGSTAGPNPCTDALVPVRSETEATTTLEHPGHKDSLGSMERARQDRGRSVQVEA